MKQGDIVYFGEPYTALYSDNSPSGSYEYHFKPGDRYRIDEIINWKERYDGNPSHMSGSITNLEDGKSHFAHTSIWERIITQEEWRERQLNKLVQGQ